MKLSNLSDEELRKISLMKNKVGCATAEAYRAQQILWKRSFGDWGYVKGHRPENVPYGDNETYD